MVRHGLQRLTWLGATALLCLWTATSLAQTSSSAGTSGYSFLKIPQSARLVALGGASVAEASDAAAMQLNPGGLAQQRFRTWSATYSNLFTDVQSGFLSYSQAIEDETVIGIALTYLSSTGIPRRDNFNNDLGTFGFSDLALSVGVGTRLVGGPDTLSADMRRRLRIREFRLDGGVMVKGIYEKLDQFSSTGIAVDLGLLAHMPDDRTRVGVSLLHAGTQASGYIDEKDPLPLSFVAGVRHRLREAPLMVTADVMVPRDNKARFGVGGEVNLGAGRNRPAPLAIRAGYNSQGRDLRTAAEQSGIAGFSFGLGVQWRVYKLDYSYTPGLGLGTLHRFTLSGQIGS
jgi:hypothetical protein